MSQSAPQDIQRQMAELFMAEYGQQPQQQRVQVADGGATAAMAAALIGSAGVIGAGAIDAKIRGDKSVPAQMARRWQEGPPLDDQGLERGNILPITRDPKTNTLSPAVPGILYYPYKSFENAARTGEITPAELVGMGGLATPGTARGGLPGRAVPDGPPPPPRGPMQGVPNVYQKPPEYVPQQVELPRGPSPEPPISPKAAASDFHAETWANDRFGQGGRALAGKLTTNSQGRLINKDTGRFERNQIGETAKKLKDIDQAANQEMLQAMQNYLKKQDKTNY